MNSRQWSDLPTRVPPGGVPGPLPPNPSPSSAARLTAASAAAGLRSPAIEWKSWTRALDRRRRQGERAGSDSRHNLNTACLPREYLADVTRASFLLDGIEVSDRELAATLVRGPAARTFRSRGGQRLRNHVALLRRIESLARHALLLDARAVVRWYTSISWGLSTSQLGSDSMFRLDRAVRRINSPHRNLRPAVAEAARLYFELLKDPIVPSFNGILGRLLLNCQLGRLGLAPVLFDPAADRKEPPDEMSNRKRLLDRILASYDRLNA
jgi:hypothetical protein